MAITKITSTGALGAESAALDLAIKLGVSNGGFAPEHGAKVINRFDLNR